jgi:hypothetical protein
MTKSLIVILIISHILALFLAYTAFCIVFYQWFKIYLPFPNAIENNNLLSISVYFILPILSFAIIKLNHKKLLKILGYTYIVFWALAVIRYISLLE